MLESSTVTVKTRVLIIRELDRGGDGHNHFNQCSTCDVRMKAPKEMLCAA